VSLAQETEYLPVELVLTLVGCAVSGVVEYVQFAVGYTPRRLLRDTLGEE